MRHHCRYPGDAGVCHGLISKVRRERECSEPAAKEYYGVCVSSICATDVSQSGIWVGKQPISVPVYCYWRAGSVDTMEVWGTIEEKGFTSVVGFVWW